jgi:hypothetical protein
MMERASSHALACSGEEWAEWGERWANTTAGRLFKSGSEKPCTGMAPWWPNPEPGATS